MFARFFARLADAFTMPMTGNEWDLAHAMIPHKVNAYHRGIITARELARTLRSYCP